MVSRGAGVGRSEAPLTLPARIHCVGVGGGGLAPLACLLAARGHRLSGSDLVGAKAELTDAGVSVARGHDAAHLGDAELVIRSAAVPEDNPEVAAAHDRGLPVLKYSEALGRLMTGRRGIALAGTHGKTTSTALVAHLLREVGADPSWIVGGEPVGLPAWGAGASDLVVVEACEYDHSFLSLEYHVAVVTGVSPYHLGCFGDAAGVRGAFAAFAARVAPGGRLVLGPEVDADFPPPPGVDAVRVDDALPLTDLREDADGFAGTLVDTEVAGGRAHAFRLPVLGRHNVDHLRTALVACRAVGAPLEALLEAAASFGGVRRRLEDLGETTRFGTTAAGHGVRVVDDFAHHPEALRAGAAACRARFPGRRLVGVFQPHQVSRTEDFLDGFREALGHFDRVDLCDIFVARDSRPERADDVASRLAAGAGAHVRRVGPAPEAAAEVAARLSPGDVCVVMGAGDVDGLAREVTGGAARPA